MDDNIWLSRPTAYLQFQDCIHASTGTLTCNRLTSKALIAVREILTFDLLNLKR